MNCWTCLGFGYVVTADAYRRCEDCGRFATDEEALAFATRPTLEAFLKYPLWAIRDRGEVVLIATRDEVAEEMAAIWIADPETASRYCVRAVTTREKKAWYETTYFDANGKVLR